MTSSSTMVVGPVLDSVVGRFLDRFERRDGVWTIADRVVLRDIRRNVPLVDPGDLFERSQAVPRRPRPRRGGPVIGQHSGVCERARHAAGA